MQQLRSLQSLNRHLSDESFLNRPVPTVSKIPEQQSLQNPENTPEHTINHTTSYLPNTQLNNTIPRQHQPNTTENEDSLYHPNPLSMLT